MKRSTGIILGMGLGGLIDGIALNQIAQWHNMGSTIMPLTTMAAMRLNMRWDGYFQLATLSITVLGVMLLWRDGFRRQAIPTLSAFTGQIILGWGLFNVVEGVIGHHLLELHHVRDVPHHMPLYDWVFLGVGGVAMIYLGWALSRTRTKPRLAVQYREAA